MKLFKSLFMSLLVSGLLVSLSFGGSAVKIFDTSGVPQGINIDSGGNLGVSGGLAISKGEVPNTFTIHKFGEAPDFDIDAGYATIWDGSDDSGLNQNQYVWPVAADIVSISSSSALNTDSTSHIHYVWIDPQKFGEKTDLILEASTDTNSVGVSGGFDLVLVANE